MPYDESDASIRDAQADMLKGADAIAKHLFGPAGWRRQVYYLVERMHLPIFRLGQVIYARRSTLAAWIADQEQSSLSSEKGR